MNATELNSSRPYFIRICLGLSYKPVNTINIRLIDRSKFVIQFIKVNK